MSEFAIANILQNARDGVTKAITMVDFPHHAIHDGNSFYQESFTTMSDTQEYFVKVAAPNTEKQMHLVWDVDVNGVLEIGGWETAVGGMTGGTTKAPINYNRNSTKGSSVAFAHGCSSATAIGTKIHEWKVGGNVFKGKFGGSGNRRDEMVLLPNTTYLKKFISGSTGLVVSFRAAWYELRPTTGLKVAD